MWGKKNAQNLSHIQNNGRNGCKVSESALGFRDFAIISTIILNVRIARQIQSPHVPFISLPVALLPPHSATSSYYSSVDLSISQEYLTPKHELHCSASNERDLLSSLVTPSPLKQPHLFLSSIGIFSPLDHFFTSLSLSLKLISFSWHLNRGLRTSISTSLFSKPSAPLSLNLDTHVLLWINASYRVGIIEGIWNFR